MTKFTYKEPAKRSTKNITELEKYLESVAHEHEPEYVISILSAIFEELGNDPSVKDYEAYEQIGFHLHSLASLMSKNN